MNKKIIIDNRMRSFEKQKIKDMGYQIIEIKTESRIYEEISSHVDIFTCKIGEKIVVEPSQYGNILEQLEDKTKIVCGTEKVEMNYPKDIKYNVCVIGKKAIHKLDVTDETIKQQLINQNYELINTTQGYTNCSIAVIDDNSAIVSDNGLQKILMAHGIETLLINNNLDIKLLKNNKYSDKKGFIGGCISKIGDKIIVFGDLDKIDVNGEIRGFIKNRSKEIIEFKNHDIIDYGGIVEI